MTPSKSSAASVIDRDTWILLAERIAEIKRARQRFADEPDDSVELVFDKHDQAHILRKDT